MSLRIRFACDHDVYRVDDLRDAAPRCPVCGERRVQSVVTDRPPRFRGLAVGPCAQPDPHIAATVISVAADGPLPLKE